MPTRAGIGTDKWTLWTQQPGRSWLGPSRPGLSLPLLALMTTGRPSPAWPTRALPNRQSGSLRGPIKLSYEVGPGMKRDNKYRRAVPGRAVAALRAALCMLEARGPAPSSLGSDTDRQTQIPSDTGSSFRLEATTRQKRMRLIPHNPPEPPCMSGIVDSFLQVGKLRLTEVCRTSGTLRSWDSGSGLGTRVQTLPLFSAGAGTTVMKAGSEGCPQEGP